MEPHVRHKMTLRLLELKALQQQSGVLSTEHQIEHDQLVARMLHLDWKLREKMALIARKIGWEIR